MTVGELFSRETELAAQLRPGPAPRLRLVADGVALDGRGVRRRRSTCARRLFGPDAWPTDRPVEPRPVSARRRACRRRSGAIASRTATRSRGPPPSCSSTLRGTPFLYYGEEIGMRRRATSRATRSSIRRRCRAGPGLPVVRPRPAAGRRCSGRPARTPGSRPAGRGCGSAPDADHAERRGPGGGPGLGAGRLPAAARAAAGRRRRSGRARWPARRAATPDVLGLDPRGAGDQRLLVVVSFVGEPRPSTLPRDGDGGLDAPVGGHREPSTPSRRTLALRPTRPSILGGRRRRGRSCSRRGLSCRRDRPNVR